MTKLSVAILSWILLPMPLFAQSATAPEDIPLYRLGQTIPVVDTMQEAQDAMATAINMTTVPTIAREPAPGTWEPFCQGDCIELQAVATFEAKNFGAELPTCETIRAGLVIATAAWAEIQTGTTRLRQLTEELEGAQGTDRFNVLLTELNQVITHINEETRKVRTAYPASFNAIDRKVVFTWTASPTRLLAGWPRNWVAQGLGLELDEAVVRGYTWKTGQGQVTDLGGIEGLPSAVGRGLRFAMDATPVQICGEGREVALAGQLTLDIGLYDEALSAWRTNARTTVKAVLKGTPP